MTKDLLTEPEVLSAEEVTFTRLVAKGYNYTTAYRKSHPAKSKLSYGRIRVLAHELATDQNIVTEIASTKETTARLARLAESRIEEVLEQGSVHGKGGITTSNVAMFMYDHANGKATQKIESKSAHVSVIYDLSGKGEEVPPEIAEQLKNL